MFIGWYATNRERKRTLFVFVSMASVLFAVWCLMYDAAVFRYTWLEWPFFGCVTVAAQVVILLSIVLALVRWRGFGKGLGEYCKFFFHRFDGFDVD